MYLFSTMTMSDLITVFIDYLLNIVDNTWSPIELLHKASLYQRGRIIRFFRIFMHSYASSVTIQN